MLQTRIEHIKDPVQRAHRLIDECYDKIAGLASKHPALKPLLTVAYQTHLADAKAVAGTFVGEKIALTARQVSGKSELIGFADSACQFLMVDDYGKALPADQRFAQLDNDQKQILRFLDLLSVLKQLTLIDTSPAGLVTTNPFSLPQIKRDAEKTKEFIVPLFEAIEPNMSRAAQEFSPMFFGGYHLTGVPEVTAGNFQLLAQLHDFLYRVLTTTGAGEAQKLFGALQFVVDRFSFVDASVPAMIGQALIPRLLALDWSLRKQFTMALEPASLFLQKAGVVEANAEVVVQENYLQIPEQIPEQKDSAVTYYPERMVRYTSGNGEFRVSVDALVKSFQDLQLAIVTAPLSLDAIGSGPYRPTLAEFYVELANYKATLSQLNQEVQLIKQDQARILAHRTTALPTMVSQAGVLVDASEVVTVMDLMKEVNSLSSEAYNRFQYDVADLPLRPIFPIDGMDRKPVLQAYDAAHPAPVVNCQVHPGSINHVEQVNKLVAKLDEARAPIDATLNAYASALKLVRNFESSALTRGALQQKVDHPEADQKTMSDADILNAERGKQEANTALAQRLIDYFNRSLSDEKQAELSPESQAILNVDLKDYPELLPEKYLTLPFPAKVMLISRIVPLMQQLIPKYKETLAHIQVMLEGDVEKLRLQHADNAETLQAEQQEEKALRTELRQVQKRILAFDAEEARLEEIVAAVGEQKALVETWAQDLQMLEAFQRLLNEREGSLLEDERVPYQNEIIPYQDPIYVRDYPAFVKAMGWDAPALDPLAKKFEPTNLQKAYSGTKGTVSAWVAYAASFVTDRGLLVREFGQLIAERTKELEMRAKREITYTKDKTVAQSVLAAQAAVDEFRAKHQAERSTLADRRHAIEARCTQIVNTRSEIENKQISLSSTIAQLQATHDAEHHLAELATDLPNIISSIAESKADIAYIKLIVPVSDEELDQKQQAGGSSDTVLARLFEIDQDRAYIRELNANLDSYLHSLDVRVSGSMRVKAKHQQITQNMAALNDALKERHLALVEKSAHLLRKPYQAVLDQLTAEGEGELALQWIDETQICLMRKIKYADGTTAWQDARVVLHWLETAEADVSAAAEEMHEALGQGGFVTEVEQHGSFSAEKQKADQEIARLRDALSRYQVVKAPLEAYAAELHDHYHSSSFLAALFFGLIQAFVMLVYLIVGKVMPEDRDKANLKRVSEQTNIFVVQGDADSADDLGNQIRLAKRELPKECAEELTTLAAEVEKEKLRIEHPEAAAAGEAEIHAGLAAAESSVSGISQLLSRFASTTVRRGSHSDGSGFGSGSESVLLDNLDDDDLDSESMLHESSLVRPVSPSATRHRNATPSPTRSKSDPIVAPLGSSGQHVLTAASQQLWASKKPVPPLRLVAVTPDSDTVPAQHVAFPLDVA